MTATGIACRRCGSRTVLIEAHTMRGVSGVACERCTTCGALEVISRRAPSAEDQHLAHIDDVRPPRATTDARCEDCALPLDGQGVVCADCRKRRQSNRGPRVTGPRVANCRTPGCKEMVTSYHKNAIRQFCPSCRRERRRAQQRAHANRTKRHNGEMRGVA